MQISSITNDKSKQQFYLMIDDAKAFIDYTIEDGTYMLNHAEVPSELRGRSIGQILVEKTLAEIEKEGKTSIARCPFVQRVAQKISKRTKDR